MAKITSVLQHRGPDDSGYWIFSRAALGHTRLAIIDLDTGAQPITDEQVRAIVFNGEIYNYRELRNDLINRESRFGTVSDTEVIFEAYKELLLHKQRQNWFLEVRYENKALELAQEKTAIAIQSKDKIVETIEKVIEAVIGKELDTAIAKAVSKRNANKK